MAGNLRALALVLLPLVVGCGSSLALVTAPTTPDAVGMMRRGEADAVVGDYPAIAYTARESAGALEQVGQPFESTTFGMAVDPEAAPLQSALAHAFRAVSNEYNDVLRNWGLAAGRVTPEASGERPESASVPQLADGTLRVGMDIAYAPMEFMDGGREAGVDVEIARLLARNLGVEVEFVNMNFEQLIPAVRGGDIDLAISSMTITDARSEQVHFIPYFQTGSGILVTSGNPHGIRVPRDLCSRTIAFQEGTVQIQYFRDLCRR